MPKYVHMDDESVERVCSAIMRQAIKDYASDPDGYWGAKAKDFFRTDWFTMISNGMDGEDVLIRMDKRLKEFQALCRKNKPQIWKNAKEAAKCLFICPFCGGKVKIQWNDRSRNMLKYTHQCDTCGVRQTYIFIGDKTSVDETMHYCKECLWHKQTRAKHMTCIKHNMHTTARSFCNDWEPEKE